MATPQPYEKVSKLSKKRTIEIIFWVPCMALGATVGLSIIFALLGILTKGHQSCSVCWIVRFTDNYLHPRE